MNLSSCFGHIYSNINLTLKKNIISNFGMQQALDSVITLAKLQFTQKKWVFFFSQIDNQKSPNDDRILHLVPEFGE